MIELKNVSVGYGGKPLLSSVDLKIGRGELLVLLGPNGCGKSTLLKTILGLERAMDGEILIDRRPITSYSRRELAQKLSYLSQSRNVPSMTAFRMVLHGRFPYLSFPRSYRKEDLAAAEAALQAVDAADLSHRYMPELSGGQRQKVYLAMALSQGTDSILMDEPTTYLDIAHQLEFMALAQRLAGEGKTVLLVLHDICLAMRYADEIAVFSDGALRFCGTPEALFDSGLISSVFHVSVQKTATAGGDIYYYG